MSVLQQRPSEDEEQRRPTVLLASDGAEHERLLESLVERECQVRVVLADIRAVLDTMTSLRPAVLLLRTDDPAVDGVDITRRLRADGANRQIPVVIVAPDCNDDAFVECLRAGADDCMFGPLNEDALVARIENCLQRVAWQKEQDSVLVELEQRNQMLDVNIKNAMMLADNLQDANNQLRQALEAAAKIQQSLLPVNIPQIPGLRFAFDHRPCQALAGDSMGIFPLDEERVGLYILDVSGHGIPAALLSVTVTQFLSPGGGSGSFLQQTGGDQSTVELKSPARVSEDLNRQFPMDKNAGQYFTMIYGILHLGRGELEYVTAGHPGPLLVPRGEKARSCHVPGFPVGVFDEAVYDCHSLRLRSGDRLYLFTDGMVESANSAQEQYGSDRLAQTVEATRDLDLEKSVATVIDKVLAWCVDAGPQDDLSVMAIELE